MSIAILRRADLVGLSPKEFARHWALLADLLRSKGFRSLEELPAGYRRAYDLAQAEFARRGVQLELHFTE